MSLEAALEANTAALARVADLLEVSNADRAKLLASAGGAAAPTPASGGTDDGLSVAEVKEKVKSADLPTLQAMLVDEKSGKARATAVKAIEDAIAAATPGNAPGESDAGSASSGSTTQIQADASTTASGAAASDKNAQPVPQGVTAEQAREAIGAWVSETDDADERAKRTEFVAKIVGKLGSRIGELDSAKARQAVFYLRRKRAGLDVDFDAGFDFDGSPTQTAPAAAASTGGAATDDLL